MVKLVCICVLAIAAVGWAKPPAQLASFIKPCSRSDPKLDDCIVNNGNEAIPTLVQGHKGLKIPVFNPLEVNEVLIEPGNNLHLLLTKIKVYGLDKAKIIESKANIEKKQLDLKLEFPTVEIIGDYEIKGSILILPISGKGPANITLENPIIHYHLQYEVKEVKGINQIVISENTIEYEPKRVYYKFDNLFNGDERLGKEMAIFLNENWKEVNNELSSGLKETILAIIQLMLSNVFRNVPYDEILLP